MANFNDESPEDDVSAEPADPPYQALFPNLDKVSRDSFRAGTVSRRRINRALVFLAVVIVAVIALVVLANVLFGPGGPLR
ncbi:hypothetical protein ACLRGF_05155 [Mycetocola zhadangensis]|jgi:hypothetical protein|uniref:hypothetical protein n=1 Tax=Mycetocola zhadangensis TaxID=1164595 RepID=UPI003A4DD148